MSTFVSFMEDASTTILVVYTCHFAFDAVAESLFNDCLIAIDEFHHVSADADNRLGEVLRSIMANTSAHIIAMTGSYFRGLSFIH